MGLGNAQI